MNKKLFTASAVSLMLTATFATAGGHDNLGRPSTAVAARTVAATATAPVAQKGDWSGFYVGGSFGSVTDGTITFIDGIDEGSVDADDHSPIGGFIGYQVQSGQFVFGGEYAIAVATDVTFGGGSNEYAAAYGDLKARVGFAFGQLLVYGVAGTSATAFDDGVANDFSSTGFGYGVGADYAVGPNIILGAEYFSRSTTGEVTALGATVDAEIDIDTFTFRAAYKF